MLKHFIRISIYILFIIVSFNKIAAEEENERTAIEDSVKVSSIWTNTIWKQIKDITDKERTLQAEKSNESIETGAKATEQDLEEKLIFKEKSQFLYTDDIKQAIDLLNNNISKELYLIGQCYTKLGKKRNALSYYERIIKEFPESDWVKKAQEAKEKIKSK